MPKRRVIEDGKLQRLLATQHDVISRSQALECGIPQSTVNTWCKPGGRWQKLLPGVYLTVTGKVAIEQRQVAALLYAGKLSVITGPAAVRLHRLRSPGGDAIDVLIPSAVKRQSTRFVRIQRSDLPQPKYNVFLRATDGTDIGETDAWWADAGVSAEIDSQEYHFYREGWLRTDAKHSRMLKYGIFPHHFAPTRVNNDWRAIYEELRSSIDMGRQRPRLPVIAFDTLG
jgi:hypothetical protein